jgi:hypothetical protein
MAIETSSGSGYRIETKIQKVFNPSIFIFPARPRCVLHRKPIGSELNHNAGTEEALAHSTSRLRWALSGSSLGEVGPGAYLGLVPILEQKILASCIELRQSLSQSKKFVDGAGRKIFMVTR